MMVLAACYGRTFRVDAVERHAVHPALSCDVTILPTDDGPRAGQLQRGRVKFYMKMKRGTEIRFGPVSEYNRGMKVGRIVEPQQDFASPYVDLPTPS